MRSKKFKSIFWNMIGSGLMSAQAALILIFVSRRSDIATAGMISIGYALGSLFFCLARYGVKNFQATDINEEFGFNTYLNVRIITVIAALAGAIAYLAVKGMTNTYDTGKSLLICEIVVLKLIDASEDVFAGRFQQVGHFIVGARIMAVRLTVVTLAISLAVYAGAEIHIAFLVGIILSVLLSALLVYKKRSVLKYALRRPYFNKAQTLSLLKKCLPLCVATTIAIYVGNIPKYLIDMYLDERIQAIFGYIMLPVFVITMLNQFIYMPFVKELGDLWNNNNITGLKKRVLLQCGIVFALAIPILLGFLFIGLPLLSGLYNVDLSPYKKEFIILLCGGTLYSMAYYLTIPLTTIRKQSYIAAAYILVSVIVVFTGGIAVKGYGMSGASVLYLIINAFLFTGFTIAFLHFVNKGKT